MTRLPIFFRTKSFFRKWKIQVWAIGMKMCYNWNNIPHDKSNEAELNLFWSTDETSPTGWHLVTSMFTAIDKPGYNCIYLRNDNSGEFRKIVIFQIFIYWSIFNLINSLLSEVGGFTPGDVSVVYTKLLPRDYMVADCVTHSWGSYPSIQTFIIPFT